MSNIYLKTILREYEQKRLLAEQDLAVRKAELYSKQPRLKEIDEELGKYAISAAKLILSADKNSLSEFMNKKDSLNKEKILILKSLGKSYEYLQPVFECDICKDTGYIPSTFNNELCNCLKQEIFNLEFNKYNMGNLEQDTFENFNPNFYSDVADSEKYNSDISPKENILNIKKTAESFIANFNNPDEKNLLFRGPSGLGKTFLSNCIANELIKQKKTVMYQTAPVLLDEVIACRMNRQDSNPNILKNILTADLLIIDDLGTESINSMKFTELFNIINTRLLNQNMKITKTIISTNFTLQEMYSVYDERIVSRIVGHYQVCKFFGDDIRFKKI